MSRLVVMGSGETAPTMVRVHREILATAGEGPAAMLDTPFAFQMNADELVARTLTYFEQSVGVTVEVASWPRRDAPTVVQERALALLGRARWAFAGPGSPTYALRQWRGTGVPDTLAGVVRRGGTLVMGSAAAVTLGGFAVPVYEVYKVGADPEWVEGLDLLQELTGLQAAVIPHYDNKEGGTHDTRFCYLGETRLAMLEERLPDEVGVLGVDEHTAALLDVEARDRSPLPGQAGDRTRDAATLARSRRGSPFAFDDLDADAPRRRGRVVVPRIVADDGAARACDGTATPRPVAGRDGRRGRKPTSSGLSPTATSSGAWRWRSASSSRSPTGTPTRCRATTSRARGARCGRWWCGSASSPRPEPTRAARSLRSSSCCWSCAHRRATTATSRRPTWCATGWPLRASRCATPPTAWTGSCEPS